MVFIFFKEMEDASRFTLEASNRVSRIFRGLIWVFVYCWFRLFCDVLSFSGTVLNMGNCEETYCSFEFVCWLSLLQKDVNAI